MLMLLSLSCGAYACEVSCEVEAIGGGCHGQAMRAGGPMSGMGAGRGGMLRSAESAAMVGVTCAHRVCSQGMNLLKDGSGPEVSGAPVDVVSRLPGEGELRVAAALAWDGPPGRIPFAAPLRSNLRI